MNRKSKTREGIHALQRRPRGHTRFVIAVVVVLFSCSIGANSQTRHRSAATSTSPALVITSEPNAIIWLDEVRRGVTDAAGKIALTKVSAGRHVLSVRANGFKEVTLPLLHGRHKV